MIIFDLNRNDAEALLHHVESFKPNSGDARKVASILEGARSLPTTAPVA